MNCASCAKPGGARADYYTRIGNLVILLCDPCVTTHVSKGALDPGKVKAIPKRKNEPQRAPRPPIQCG